MKVEGWEDRVVGPEGFSACIWMNGTRDEDLTEDERQRLGPKLRMIEKLAVELASLMHKGTVKYSSDEGDPDHWRKHRQEEWLDSVNYHLLEQDAIEREATNQTVSERADVLLERLSVLSRDRVPHGHKF